jgi:hypothetical protein
MKRLLAAFALFLLGLAATALLARPGAGSVADGTLSGTVGPGFSISLKQNGAGFTHLAAGTYTITVSDQSPEHNFHLVGTGVNEATDVEGAGTTTWTVTFVDGTYNYLCDAHPATMLGKFTVGDVTTTTTTTTAAAALSAHIGMIKPLRTAVRAPVWASQAGTGTLGLYKGTTRLAVKTAAVGRTPKTLILRPPKPLKAGSYTLRLRVTAGAASARTAKPFVLH